MPEDDVSARLARIEANIATKADLEVAVATAVAGLATKADLAPFATKADLEGVAKNVDITKLSDDVRRLRDDVIALKDDLAVTTAIAQRLDHVTSRLIVDVLTEIRAEHSRMDRLLGRVRALEGEP
jgi:adenylosuccinate lyase